MRNILSAVAGVAALGAFALGNAQAAEQLKVYTAIEAL